MASGVRHASFSKTLRRQCRWNFFWRKVLDWLQVFHWVWPSNKRQNLPDDGSLSCVELRTLYGAVRPANLNAVRKCFRIPYLHRKFFRELPRPTSTGDGCFLLYLCKQGILRLSLLRSKNKSYIVCCTHAQNLKRPCSCTKSQRSYDNVARIQSISISMDNDVGFWKDCKKLANLGDDNFWNTGELFTSVLEGLSLITPTQGLDVQLLGLFSAFTSRHQLNAIATVPPSNLDCLQLLTIYDIVWRLPRLFAQAAQWHWLVRKP